MGIPINGGRRAMADSLRKSATNPLWHNPDSIKLGGRRSHNLPSEHACLLFWDTDRPLYALSATQTGAAIVSRSNCDAV